MGRVMTDLAFWFLPGIQTDLRDVRKEMTGMRVESAVTNTKLEELIAEFRRLLARPGWRGEMDGGEPLCATS
jgi:hypothetical protein